MLGHRRRVAKHAVAVPWTRGKRESEVQCPSASRSSSFPPYPLPPLQDAVPGKKDFGQVWRDRLRLVQLENNGWKVYSCDLGHEESLGETDRHLQSNFDHHRFPEAFKKRWPEGLELRQVSKVDESM